MPTFPRKRFRSRNPLAVLLGLILLPAAMPAQSSGDLRQILERLERLEAENRALAQELRALRQELADSRSRSTAARDALPPAEPDAGAPAALEEPLEIHDRRIDEHQQTKVEGSQKFPLKLTGIALFNTFLNSKGAGGSDNPTVAALTPGASGGATFRQTVIGLQFDGPRTFLGGRVHGDLYMDLFGGTNAPLNHSPRLRVASVSLNWPTRTLMVGHEKPLISPREPNSLSQMGVSPLTNAGNLWLWLPQVRFEQRFPLAESTLLKAQFAVFQTSETSIAVPSEFADTLAPRRPGWQGRLEFSHDYSDGRRLAIAPGFHASSTHVAATSVPSRLLSLDWFVKPFARFEFTGAAITGSNIANMGSLRQGVTVLRMREAIAIRSRGGWVQATYLATDRLTFNAYAGQIDDHDRDLRGSGIARNLSYAANGMYRLAPNVIVSLEAAKVRTTYLGRGNRQNNHYDVAVAYLF